MDRILCAAIKHEDTFVCGYRHRDCCDTIEKMLKVDKYLPVKENRWFLTSIGRFVNRQDAYKIARAANQLLLPHVEGCEETLISENLY